MEHYHQDNLYQNQNQINVLLSIDLSCCEKCPRRLCKNIKKLRGVKNAVLCEEDNLVSVVGTVGEMDPLTLLNDISDFFGKSVRMVPNRQFPNNSKHQYQFKEIIHKDTHNDNFHHASTSKHNSTGWNKTKVGERGHCKHSDCDGKKDKEHKFETYVPKEIDPRICRDPYCKDHQKMRDIAHRIPMDDQDYGDNYGFAPMFFREFQANPYAQTSYHPGMYGQGMPPFGYQGRSFGY